MKDRLKAYAVTECHENNGFICWTENSLQARKLVINYFIQDVRYIDLRCKRVPEADALYYGEQLCSWDTEKGQQIYYDLEWRLDDADNCNQCGRYEFEKVKESKLNEDGECINCVENN